MAQTFLIFDFGGDEEAAQKARLRIERWKQGFRLDRKMLVRFEREDAETAEPDEGGSAEKAAGAEKGEHAEKGGGAEKSSGKSGDSSGGHAHPKAKKDGAAGSKSGDAAARIRLLVRLDFSDHEKLSHQRWRERIPAEEMFAAAKPEIVARGDKDFEATAKRFEALEAQPGPPSAR